MNLYIMRHGITVWNEKGITQGRSNNRLSVNGKELVKQKAKENENTKFDVIFCSPLTRTIQTANIMNEYHNIKIIRDERLTETEEGIFTRIKKANLTERELEQKIKRDASCGMESYESVYIRVNDFIYDIKQNYEYKNILIVTHNSIAFMIENVILNNKIDYEDEKNIGNFKNAELRHYKC